MSEQNESREVRSNESNVSAESRESQEKGSAGAARGPKKKYVPAVTPRLRIALIAVFALFAILLANSLYLGSVTALEAITKQSYQDYFYLLMFLLHLVLGFLLLVPFTLFAWFHLIATRKRRNKMAVRMGYALLAVCLVLLVSGIALTRIVGVLELKQPLVRTLVYWAHVIAPVAAIWLYWLHRLAGPPIKWRVGLSYAGVVGVVVLGLLFVKAQDPRKWATAGSPSSATYFEPSLARTRDGDFISADVMMNDDYCLECHQDIYNDWQHSAHKLSSFNNPLYLTSVVQLRDELMERDGDVKASRWCAGCHDPVPFFSGKFDNPNYDVFKDETASAGITCTVCHSITHVNSLKGNADYTIEGPVHYPFVDSENPLLAWVNRQLVKAKPSFHKQVFLKPLHKTPDFCASCHKVHLPGVLTQYKDFLRGQNHFDSYHLSGVSGHGLRSFYYPPKAQENCNECHMPRRESDDFGAQLVDGRLSVHDHLFPSANTGLTWLYDKPEQTERHMRFNDGVMRVDLFGIKEGQDISAPLIGPLRPEVPTLNPGQSYLLETVIRTLKMGHHFTQGTVDSNEIWLDVTVIESAEYDQQGARIGGRVIGRSGGLNEQRAVDPWAHFVNVFMLDRDGNRINRRNAQDIFVPLYNHQIPPGAGQVVHYGLDLPADVAGPVTVEVKLQYRKFDAEYMQIVADFHRQHDRPLRGLDPDSDTYVNQLPIMTMASDRVTFPVAGSNVVVENAERDIPTWQRWNDYGIGLLLESMEASGQGELSQAEHAFQQVEALGQFHGPINLARVYNADGRLDEATDALARAVVYQDQENYPAWTVLWLTGVINRQQNHLDQAIENLEAALNYRTEETVARGFDFSQDYVVTAELISTMFDRSKQLEGAERVVLLKRCMEASEKVLAIDFENAPTHYLRSQVFDEMSAEYPEDSSEAIKYAQLAEEAREAHARYKMDENVRDRAVTIARAQYPAANEAAERVKIYKLHREGAYELTGSASEQPAVATPATTSPDNDSPITRDSERRSTDAVESTEPGALKDAVSDVTASNASLIAMTTAHEHAHAPWLAASHMERDMSRLNSEERQLLLEALANQTLDSLQGLSSE